MKQRIVIHVGMPRAGSSTLQEAMFFHRDKLAQAGISYAVLQSGDPAEGKPGFEYNHRLMNGAAKGFLQPRNNFRPMMKAVIEIIRNHPGRISVLSYEGWWDPRNLRALQRILQHLRKELPNADLELSAVVREPVSFLFSLYKLDVLHGRTQSTFVENLPRALSDPRLRYGSISSALTGVADKVTFLDFEMLAAGGRFCSAALLAMTGMDPSQHPALAAFCHHRSGGTAYFSDAVVSMMRFASAQLDMKTIQRHRQEIHDILLRLSGDPRMSQHCDKLVVPLSGETASKIGVTTRPLVQDFYARHLPTADTRFVARHDGNAQSEIVKDSALGQEVLGALSAFRKEREPWWRFGRSSG